MRKLSLIILMFCASVLFGQKVELSTGQLGSYTDNLRGTSDTDSCVIYVQPGEAIATAIAGITDESATNPYVVVLRAGRHTIISTLTMAKHISLKGEGISSTELYTTTNLDPMITLADSMSISNMTIYHNGADDDDQAILMHDNNARHDLILRNLYLRHNNSTYDACIIDNRSYDWDNVLIENVHFVGDETSSPDGEGIYTNGAATRPVIIRNCVFQNLDTGIHNQVANDLQNGFIVENCLFTNCDTYAIYVRHTAAVSSYMYTSHNTFLNNGSDYNLSDAGAGTFYWYTDNEVPSWSGNTDKIVRTDMTLADEVTISSAAVIVYQRSHIIDTEGDAALDTLDTINSGTASSEMYLLLRTANDARDVFLDNGGGNLNLGSDRSLESTNERVLLHWDGTAWELASMGEINHYLSASDGIPAQAVYVDATGNVGIGTTGPGEKLDMNGNIKIVSDGTIYGDNTNNRLILNNTNTIFHNEENYVSLTSKNIITLGVDANNNGAGFFSIGKGEDVVGDTNWQEFVRITNGGNVGIGTTAPDGKLEINHGTSGKIRGSYNDSDGSATDYWEIGIESDGQTTLTTVDADASRANFTFALDGFMQVGIDGIDGTIKLYSEQGGTDYSVSLNPNSAMTSDADFYFPADEPGATYLVNCTSGGAFGYDTNTYLTSANFAKDLVSGNGLDGGVDDILYGSDSDVTLAVLVDYNGGIEIVDDSINVKLDGATLTLSTSGLKVTDNTYQSLDATLTALAGLSLVDVSVIEGTGADAVGIVSSGGNNYILGSNSDNSALEFKTPANVLTQIGGQATDADLTALAGLSSTGLVSRTGAASYSERTITGTTAQIAVTNGDGVSGNPTLSLPDTLNIDTSKLVYSPTQDSLYATNIKVDNIATLDAINAGNMKTSGMTIISFGTESRLPNYGALSGDYITTSAQNTDFKLALPIPSQEHGETVILDSLFVIVDTGADAAYVNNVLLETNDWDGTGTTRVTYATDIGNGDQTTHTTNILASDYTMLAEQNYLILFDPAGETGAGEVFVYGTIIYYHTE